MAAITAQRISALPNARQAGSAGAADGQTECARLLAVPPRHWGLSSPTPAPLPLVSAFNQLSLEFVENPTGGLRVDHIHPTPSLMMEKI